MPRGESLGQVIVDESRSALDAYVREGPRQMLHGLACFPLEESLDEQPEEVHGQDRLDAPHTLEIDRSHEKVILQLGEAFLMSGCRL